MFSYLVRRLPSRFLPQCDDGIATVGLEGSRHDWSATLWIIPSAHASTKGTY